MELVYVKVWISSIEFNIKTKGKTSAWNGIGIITYQKLLLKLFKTFEESNRPTGKIKNVIEFFQPALGGITYAVK